MIGRAKRKACGLSVQARRLRVRVVPTCGTTEKERGYKGRAGLLGKGEGCEEMAAVTC